MTPCKFARQESPICDPGAARGPQPLHTVLSCWSGSFGQSSGLLPNARPPFQPALLLLTSEIGGGFPLDVGYMKFLGCSSCYRKFWPVVIGCFGSQPSCEPSITAVFNTKGMGITLLVSLINTCFLWDADNLS